MWDINSSIWKIPVIINGQQECPLSLRPHVNKIVTSSIPRKTQGHGTDVLVVAASPAVRPKPRSDRAHFIEQLKQHLGFNGGADACGEETGEGSWCWEERELG